MFLKESRRHIYIKRTTNETKEKQEYKYCPNLNFGRNQKKGRHEKNDT